MTPVYYVRVPANAVEDLIETALTEGARRNIAMAHIIRQGDARRARDAATYQVDVLLDWLWTYHPELAEEAAEVLEERA